jgi:hypothetical protein
MDREELLNYSDRWTLRVFAIATLLAMLIFAAAITIGYIGDEYASPAWDEQSVPAPRTY